MRPRLIVRWAGNSEPMLDDPLSVRWSDGSPATLDDFRRIEGDTQSAPHFFSDGSTVVVEFSYRVRETVVE